MRFVGWHVAAMLTRHVRQNDVHFCTAAAVGSNMPNRLLRWVWCRGSPARCAIAGGREKDSKSATTPIFNTTAGPHLVGCGAYRAPRERRATARKAYFFRGLQRGAWEAVQLWAAMQFDVQLGRGSSLTPVNMAAGYETRKPKHDDHRGTHPLCEVLRCRPRLPCGGRHGNVTTSVRDKRVHCASGSSRTRS